MRTPREQRTQAMLGAQGSVLRATGRPASGTRVAIRVLFAVLLTLVPRIALACPVCFGENDSPLALGINYGILVMLGIIGVLWVAFASFFIHLRRRARMFESATEGFADAGRPASGAPAQEGTV